MSLQGQTSIAMCNQQPSLLEEVIFPDKSYFLVEGLPKPQADRYNAGKPELSFLFDAPLAMEGLANRFSLGARKYARDNWKLGLPENELIDALLRHLKEYKKGVTHCEEFDKDGNSLGWQPHVDAIVWNAVVLSEQFHKQLNQAKDEMNNGKYA